jgi:hypothetical protein
VLSVRVTATENSSPVGYTKQVFDNSTKAIFVLENISCGQNLIKIFWKPGLFFKFETGVGQSRLELWPVLAESDDEWLCSFVGMITGWGMSSFSQK